jgi:hypothetical protein
MLSDLFAKRLTCRNTADQPSVSKDRRHLRQMTQLSENATQPALGER